MFFGSLSWLAHSVSVPHHVSSGCTWSVYTKSAFARVPAGLCCLAFFLLFSVPGYSLSMNEQRIRHFEREAVRVFRQIVTNVQPTEQTPEQTTYILSNTTFSGLGVAAGTLVCNDLSEETSEAFRQGGGDFSTLRTVKGLIGYARLQQAAVQHFIDRELARLRGKKGFISEVRVTFGENELHLAGKAFLNRIPGNVLGFLSPEAAPFSVTISLTVENSCLLLHLGEGVVNGQPITPELREQLLSWLNPLWDNSSLPYPAGFEHLDISPSAICISGWLFSHD